MRGQLGRPQASIHPNHPIFQKVPPQIAAMFARRLGQAPPPVPPGAPPPPQPLAQGTPDPSSLSSMTAAREGQPQPNSQYPWMNIPTDLSGLNQWDTDPTHNTKYRPGPDADPEANIRERLMSRFFTAQPQEPALTSRRALQAHLQRTAAQRMRRQPMLPLRRPMQRPY
jgi:hypothetical protein